MFNIVNNIYSLHIYIHTHTYIYMYMDIEKYLTRHRQEPRMN